MKFSLLTLLLTVLIAAFGAVCISFNMPRQTPVTEVAALGQWYNATSGNCQVLFVDNSYHRETEYYSDRFDLFCRSFRLRFGHNPILMHDPMENKDLWGIIENLWQGKDLNSDFHHGYKGWGGRGVIAWINNGQMVDFALIHHVETVKEFDERCDRAFKD